MFYEWFGLPVPGFIRAAFHGNENAVAFAFSQFLLLLPILYVNQKYFKVGFKTLFRGSPNMDSLIAIGASAAVVYGCFAIFRIGYGLGHGNTALVEQYAMDIYFESAGTILTLITVGKYLETKSKGKTSAAITKLMDLSPKTAIVLREDGSEEQIPTEDVEKGDIAAARKAIPITTGTNTPAILSASLAIGAFDAPASSTNRMIWESVVSSPTFSARHFSGISGDIRERDTGKDRRYSVLCRKQEIFGRKVGAFYGRTGTHDGTSGGGREDPSSVRPVGSR